MGIFKWDKKISLVGRQKEKKKPKKVAKTAEEEALERRQGMALDKEIEKSEEAFAALSRGKLGRVSLLGGSPRTSSEAASGKRSGGASGGGSLLSGSSGGSPSRGSSTRATSSRNNRGPVSRV